MDFHFELDIPKSKNVLKYQILDLLTKQRFKQKSDLDDQILFKRGSNFRNYFAFNPEKWKTIVRIEFLTQSDYKTKIITNIKVSTKGQLVTRKEEQYWIKFAENFRNSIISGVDFSETNKILSKRAFKKNLEYVKWLFLATLIFLPLGILVALFFNASKIASSIAITGIIGTLFYKINKDKKQKNIDK